ncbi:MAG: hypothetical protein PVH34_08955, partial [Syntrophobacterales bacterium]
SETNALTSMIGLLPPRHWRKGRRRKALKSEYRNSNIETNSKFEFSNVQNKNRGTTEEYFWFWSFRFW